jgi:hypothetical protein
MILLSNSKLLGLVIVFPWTTFQTTAKEYANLPSRLPLVLHVVHAPFVKLLRLLVSGLVLIRVCWINLLTFKQLVPILIGSRPSPPLLRLAITSSSGVS